MINVIVIAFEFHPLNNGGAFRPIHIVKYLKANGINPVVCTLHKDSISNYYKNPIIEEDSTYPFLKELEIIGIPSNIHRVSFNYFRNYFSIKDRDTLEWENKAAAVLEMLHKKYSPKAIFVTAPPFTLATFGRKMAEKLKLPFILDMRDAWTYWNISPYKTYIHYLLTKREERKILEAAQIISVTSQQTIDDFKTLHPRIEKNKFVLITNGYEKLAGSELQIRKIAEEDKIVIGYSGGFYYSPEARVNMFAKWWQKKLHRWLQYTPRKEDWLYRSPFFIFKTLAYLKLNHIEIYNKLELQFIGNKPSWFDEMLAPFDISEKIKHLGPVSHKESLAFQEKCDYLLITSSKVIGGKDYSIAGKTFEYISMYKPILSFVCEGAQKELLLQTGLAVICDPDRIPASALKIKNLVLGNMPLRANTTYINTLSREYQTNILAKEILHLLEASN